MKRAFPHLNSQPYTFEDVERITRRERIKLTICDYNPDILGYFCTRKTAQRVKKFIVINSRLDTIGRTFIGLHELAHYFLHAPTSPRQWFYCRRIAERTRSKHDCEADAFALIAMLPYWMMIELSSTGYQDLHPALVDLCVRRQKLWEKHGV
jgi:Zn-dependent peptidase ImmA (M78 family)